MKLISRLKNLKVIDTSKYKIIPKERSYFILTEKQQILVDSLYETKGSMEFQFKYSGIGIIFKVRILDTNEIIDLTDYDSW